MSRHLQLTMPAFALRVILPLGLIFTLALFLRHENNILEKAAPGISFPAFNRSDQTQARTIMHNWRAHEEHGQAVTTIVILDYILILVYTFFLCTAIRARCKVDKQYPARYWMTLLLRLAFYSVLAGALLDALQDSIILFWVRQKATGTGPAVFSLELLTWLKWRFLLFGIIVLLLSLLRRGLITKKHIRIPLAYAGALLKCIWLFFPSILFIVLAMVAFWVQGQGKDILVAFTEENKGNFRIAFFLVIGFWVYVTWYSSRVIAYIKVQYPATNSDLLNSVFAKFLYLYPRLAGNACLLIIELAALQAPILKYPLSGSLAFMIFFAALAMLTIADKWIGRWMGHIMRNMADRFWLVFMVYFILLMATAWISFGRISSIHYLFLSVASLHIIYLFYIQLHQTMVGIAAVSPANGTRIRMEDAVDYHEKALAFFCIPLEEKAFLKWLSWTSLCTILLYLMAITFLDVARGIGPFALVLLGFAAMLAFGNLVTAFSARLRINFHFFLFILALTIGTRETHRVRQIDLDQGRNGYCYRPTLKKYLQTWLQRLPPGDSGYDIYFILANGGASRSGYWTASILGKLQDASIRAAKKQSAGNQASPGTGAADTTDEFSKHIFCLSGTSGGGVGVATFFSLLNDRRSLPEGSYQAGANAFLRQDYFSYTAARLLGPDYFNYIFHVAGVTDRGVALEQGLEAYTDSSNYNPHFMLPFSSFKAMSDDSTSIRLPILFVNTTRMQDGNPGIVTNLQVDNSYFGSRVDVLHLLDSNKDISMASASILGARFPYLSPAGRIKNSYFVDGGYFDNSGAGVVQETIRGMINIAQDEINQHGDSTTYKAIHRLCFKILHIVNSPVNGSDTLTRVAPIKNDLFAPIFAILGAYDMQTSVNDERLRHYISDNNQYNGLYSEYHRISLYRDNLEFKSDTMPQYGEKEAPYSMNWFMSDTTRARIDLRVSQQPVLNSILNQPAFKP